MIGGVHDKSAPTGIRGICLKPIIGGAPINCAPTRYDRWCLVKFIINALRAGDDASNKPSRIRWGLPHLNGSQRWMPSMDALEINLPHKCGPIGIGTRVLGSNPYVVGGGTIIGSRFVVSPARVVCRNQALLEEFGRLEPTYVVFETRAVHNPRIARTPHGIQYPHQVTT